jgi:hypothetical protein
MTSASHRKHSSLRPQRPADAPEDSAPPDATPPPAVRLAARLRDLDRRLALLDNSLGEDALDAPLIELDSIRARIEEAAVACRSLGTSEADTSGIDDAVKRLAWAVQSLEACRQLDEAFSTRLHEVRERLAGVGQLLGLPGFAE